MQFMRTLFSLLKTPHQLTKRNHPRVNQDIPLVKSKYGRSPPNLQNKVTG